MEERREIIFTHNETRCHAMIVKELHGDERFIGEIDGYEVWQIKTTLFDQFGFVAIKK